MSEDENILDYGMPSPENMPKYALDMYAFLWLADQILWRVKRKNKPKLMRALTEYHNNLGALLVAMNNNLKFKVTGDNINYDKIKSSVKLEIAIKYAPDMYRLLVLLKILLVGFLLQWEPQKKSFKVLKDLQFDIQKLLLAIGRETLTQENNTDNA